jgi:hypothetical protein
MIFHRDAFVVVTEKYFSLCLVLFLLPPIGLVPRALPNTHPACHTVSESASCRCQTATALYSLKCNQNWRTPGNRKSSSNDVLTF